MTDPDDGTTPTDDAVDTSGSTAEETTPALVEIQPGLAVLYGDRVPEGLELIPFTLVDVRAQQSLTNAIAGITNFGNVAAQGIDGLMKAQGMVRLAPQTLKQLETAKPLVSGGWNLGTLASEGKFVAQVRWLPATSATAASVAASVGPGLALLAIQLQLSEISELAKHNIELTSRVLEVVQQDQWAAVMGHHRTVAKEIENAKHVGRVTDAIWNNVRGHQTELDTQWDLFQRKLDRHVAALRAKRGHKERRQYLVDHGEAVLADVHALLLAQSSWFMYQALRAGHLLTTADSKPEDKALLERLVEDARQLHDEALDETDWLLEQLTREFAVIAELDGKRTFKFGGQERAARDVAYMAHNLRDALAAVRAEAARPEIPTLELPATHVFKGPVPSELLRVLRLRLNVNERLIALADASCDLWSGTFVTPAGSLSLTSESAS